MKKLFILLVVVTTIMTSGYSNTISASAIECTTYSVKGSKMTQYVIKNNCKTDDLSLEKENIAIKAQEAVSHCNSFVDILKRLRCKPFTDLVADSIYNKFVQGLNNMKQPFCTYDNIDDAKPEETTAPVIRVPEVTTVQTTSAHTTTVPSTTKAPVTTKTTTTQASPVVETPAPETSENDYASEVVRLVNIERAKYGLSALTMTRNLNNAATIRANEIATSFSHTRPNGTSCFTVLKELGIGYNTCGENIAAGQRTPADVVNAWMNSEGHRANILNSSFNKIGIGVVEKSSSYGVYWAQIFTN